MVVTKQPKDVQGRFYFGTDYTLDRDYRSVCGLGYAVWQRELCPETGREHLQFFIEFTRRTRWTAVRKLLPGAHIEPCRNVEAAIAYCRKEDSRVDGPYEFGTHQHLCTGSSVPDTLKTTRVGIFLQENPTCWRSVRSLQTIRSMSMPKRTELTTLWCFYGPSGSGKTWLARKIMQGLGMDEVYWHDGSQWWDNYDQEKVVVVDEYRGSFPIQVVLKLGDCTPYKVPVKGGYVEFNSELVIFISNLTPDLLFYKHDGPSDIALRRRLKEFEFFSRD